MSSPIRTFFEIIWLYCKGFRPVEFVRDTDRISLHPSGWRVNGTGRMRRAKDAVGYLETAEPEQWRQIYCGMTPFLVSNKGNVKHLDGSAVKMNLANGRYQIMYKPEDARGRGRNGHTHKKRVYRSMLVAMAWLDFRKGDAEHEIHHINGYRTDDRPANLMVVDHEEHLRIHNLGPCGLSGLPDERLAEAAAKPKKRRRKKARGVQDEAAASPANDTGAQDEARPEQAAEAHGADCAAEGSTAPGIPADKSADANEKPRSKRRRGKRGGRKRGGTGMADAEAQAAAENVAEDASAASAADAAGSEQRGDAAQTESGAPTDRADETHAHEGACDGRGGARHDEGAMHDGTRAADDEQQGDAAQKGREEANGGRAKPEHGAPHDAGERDELRPTRKKDDASRAPEPFDRAAARARLADALAAYLDAVGAHEAAGATDEKEANRLAKPVYRALRAFGSCPDPVDAFDAALASIRTISQAYRASGAAMPAAVHSMAGTLHSVAKNAVKDIAARGDAVETACLREMLVEQANDPLFKKTAHARKFRQSISVVDSRGETK